MGALSGLSGFADVRARIAAIEARFGTQNAASTSSSATSSYADHPNFATLLDRASSTQQPADSLTASRTAFAHDLLAAIGAPETAENVRAVAAWAQAEGTAASFNPLATTRRAPGTTDFNSVGVKNYPTYAEGVQVTADTLRNGLYGNILDALARGTSAEDVARAIASSPWGTGTRVLQVLQSQSQSTTG